MKTVINLGLAFVTFGIAWAQSGSSGSVSSNWGITIAFESRLEPPKPDLANRGQSGIRHLDKVKPGMRRFLTNSKTHEYFGYDMAVETVDERARTYRVTFSALTLTPEELNLPEPASWRLLPAPAFPPPQIVTTADTMAVDLFENPATGQKIVDYVRLKRDSCDWESAGPAQVSCLKGLLEDAQQSLADKLARLETRRDAAAVADMKESEQSWETYRDSVCGKLTNETKRLQCELKLTRSHTHYELGEIY